MGIAFNRLVRMDLNSGDSVKTWRFSNMKTWSVNWEIKQVKCTPSFVLYGREFALKERGLKTTSLGLQSPLYL